MFKVLVFVYSSIHGGCPNYLSDLLMLTQSRHNLRSNNSIKFFQCKVKTKYGFRAFSNFGPDIWNTLHDDINNSESLSVFKKKLKTFLFQQAYGSV